MRSILFDDEGPNTKLVRRVSSTCAAQQRTSSAHTRRSPWKFHRDMVSKSIKVVINVADFLETQCGVLLGWTSDTVNAHVGLLVKARNVKANTIRTQRSWTHRAANVMYFSSCIRLLAFTYTMSVSLQWERIRIRFHSCCQQDCVFIQSLAL